MNNETDPLQLGKTKEEWDQIIRDFQNQPMEFIRRPHKPICLIKMAVRDQVDPSELIYNLSHALQGKMPDYYVFVIPNYETERYIDQMEIQVFYEKDFTEIQYEELKALIIDALPPKNNP